MLTYKTSGHAKKRMSQRCISSEAVDIALLYGRHGYSRGAEVYVIGRKEVLAAQKQGVSIHEYDGLHIVISDCLITAFRNKSLQFRKMCRVKKRRQRPRQRKEAS